ncbi:helix-turn-helix domain-containing protein [Kitasatospora sp. NPDC002227]|uniref:helix-turn-helix domain-containing protein n=1 Tax=Kitasatospora sp. NPDC002227 TaxID=3154773 RepID=UPI00332E59DA
MAREAEAGRRNRKLTAVPDLPEEAPAAPTRRQVFRGKRTKAVASLDQAPTLDDVARAHPGRSLTLGKERKALQFYGTPEAPNAFAMDSLEFLFVVAQYYRGNLPLRLILILIANQKAGGPIELTQERMAEILGVHRTQVNETLAELMELGIVMMLARGLYRINPVYSWRGAQLTRNPDGTSDYTEVDQSDVLREIWDSGLPEQVKYPSLDSLKEAIENDKKAREAKRLKRREERQAAENRAKVRQTETLFDDIDADQE